MLKLYGSYNSRFFACLTDSEVRLYRGITAGAGLTQGNEAAPVVARALDESMGLDIIRVSNAGDLFFLGRQGLFRLGSGRAASLEVANATLCALAQGDETGQGQGARLGGVHVDAEGRDICFEVITPESGIKGAFMKLLGGKKGGAGDAAMAHQIVHFNSATQRAVNFPATLIDAKREWGYHWSVSNSGRFLVQARPEKKAYHLDVIDVSAESIIADFQMALAHIHAVWVNDAGVMMVDVRQVGEEKLIIALPDGVTRHSFCPPPSYKVLNLGPLHVALLLESQRRLHIYDYSGRLMADVDLNPLRHLGVHFTFNFNERGDIDVLGWRNGVLSLQHADVRTIVTDARRWALTAQQVQSEHQAQASRQAADQHHQDVRRVDQQQLSRQLADAVGSDVSELDTGALGPLPDFSQGTMGQAPAPWAEEPAGEPIPSWMTPSAPVARAALPDVTAPVTYHGMPPWMSPSGAAEPPAARPPAPLPPPPSASPWEEEAGAPSSWAQALPEPEASPALPTPAAAAPSWLQPPAAGEAPSWLQPPSTEEPMPSWADSAELPAVAAAQTPSWLDDSTESAPAAPPTPPWAQAAGDAPARTPAGDTPSWASAELPAVKGPELLSPGSPWDSAELLPPAPATEPQGPSWASSELLPPATPSQPPAPSWASSELLPPATPWASSELLPPADPPAPSWASSETGPAVTPTASWASAETAAAASPWPSAEHPAVPTEPSWASSEAQPAVGPARPSTPPPSPSQETSPWGSPLPPAPPQTASELSSPRLPWETAEGDAPPPPPWELPDAPAPPVPARPAAVAPPPVAPPPVAPPPVAPPPVAPPEAVAAPTPPVMDEPPANRPSWLGGSFLPPPSTEDAVALPAEEKVTAPVEPPARVAGLIAPAEPAIPAPPLAPRPEVAPIPPVSGLDAQDVDRELEKLRMTYIAGEIARADYYARRAELEARKRALSTGTAAPAPGGPKRLDLALGGGSVPLPDTDPS